MANGRLARRPKPRRSDDRSGKSIARKIEGIDRRMQAALEKGDFVQAKQLAEEQERLLEHLMLDRHAR